MDDPKFAHQLRAGSNRSHRFVIVDLPNWYPERGSHERDTDGDVCEWRFFAPHLAHRLGVTEAEIQDRCADGCLAFSIEDVAGFEGIYTKFKFEIPGGRQTEINVPAPADVLG